MPRKANYGYDYNDDYDHDDEDEDDNDVHVEIEVEQGEAVASQEAAKPGLWRCSICTYDNESMTSCDIYMWCSSFSSVQRADKRTVGGTCKDSGVSQLAKSLFASVPRRTNKMAVNSQPINCFDVTGEGNNFTCTMMD